MAETSELRGKHPLTSSSVAKPGEKQTSAEDSDTDPDEDEDAMMELRTLFDFSERLGDRFVADRKDRINVAS